MAIINWPEEDRPREKLLITRCKKLTDAGITRYLPAYGIRGKTALDMARELLSEFGGLKKLLSSTHPHVLYQKRGFGKAKYASLKAAIELGQRYHDETLQVGETLNNSHCRQTFPRHRLNDYPHEVFACFFWIPSNGSYALKNYPTAPLMKRMCIHAKSLSADLHIMLPKLFSPTITLLVIQPQVRPTVT